MTEAFYDSADAPMEASERAAAGRWRRGRRSSAAAPIWHGHRGRFVCPCHNGNFDRQGERISGRHRGATLRPALPEPWTAPGSHNHR